MTGTGFGLFLGIMIFAPQQVQGRGLGRELFPARELIISLSQPKPLPPQPKAGDTTPTLTPWPTLAAALSKPSPTREPTPAAPLQPKGIYLGQTYIEVIPTYTEETVLGGHMYQQWQVPLNKAGHHFDTPAFGQKGNVIIVGHSFWYGLRKDFAPVLTLSPGDLLTGVNNDGGQYTYKVVNQWSSSYEDGSWLRQPPTPAKLLTLYTCNDDLTELYVVQAALIEG